MQVEIHRNLRLSEHPAKEELDALEPRRGIHCLVGDDLAQRLGTVNEGAGERVGRALKAAAVQFLQAPHGDELGCATLIPLLHDTQLHQHAQECVADQAEPASPIG